MATANANAVCVTYQFREREKKKKKTKYTFKQIQWQSEWFLGRHHHHHPWWSPPPELLVVWRWLNHICSKSHLLLLLRAGPPRNCTTTITIIAWNCSCACSCSCTISCMETYYHIKSLCKHAYLKKKKKKKYAQSFQIQDPTTTFIK